MTAAHRARVPGLLSVLAVALLLSGCTTRLSELARGRTFMQGLASGGVVEEGDVAVLAANAEEDPDESAGVTPIDTVPIKTLIKQPDGTYIEVENAQTSFIEMEGVFPEKDGRPVATPGGPGDGLAADGTPSSAYMGRGPAVQGSRLNLRPGQTATEKALELQQELADSNSREDELEARVAELEAEIARKDQRILQAIREMNATRNELIAVRGQLEEWSRVMDQLRERIKETEVENLATMQTIISLLQQFLQVEADMQIQNAAPLKLEDLVPDGQ